jgi:hypothetical protein
LLPGSSRVVSLVFEMSCRMGGVTNVGCESVGPLPDAQLDTVLYLSPVWPNVTIRDIMSPTGGSQCYMYDS